MALMVEQTLLTSLWAATSLKTKVMQLSTPHGARVQNFVKKRAITHLVH